MYRYLHVINIANTIRKTTTNYYVLRKCIKYTVTRNRLLYKHNNKILQEYEHSFN